MRLNTQGLHHGTVELIFILVNPLYHHRLNEVIMKSLYLTMTLFVVAISVYCSHAAAEADRVGGSNPGHGPQRHASRNAEVDILPVSWDVSISIGHHGGQRHYRRGHGHHRPYRHGTRYRHHGRPLRYYGYSRGPAHFYRDYGHPDYGYRSYGYSSSRYDSDGNYYYKGGVYRYRPPYRHHRYHGYGRHHRY